MALTDTRMAVAVLEYHSAAARALVAAAYVLATAARHCDGMNDTLILTFC